MLLQVAQHRLHSLGQNKDLVEVLEECNVFGHHSFAAGRRNFGAGRRRFSAGRQNFAVGRHRVDYGVVEMAEHLLFMLFLCCFMLFYVVLPCFANACCSPIKTTATAARTHDSKMLQLGASPFVLGRESSWWREVALNIIQQPSLQWLQWQRTTKKH